MLSLFSPHTYLKSTLYLKMLSVLFVAFIAVSALFLSSSKIQAATCPTGYDCTGGCTEVNQCSGGKICKELGELSTGAIRLGQSSVSCGGGEGKAVFGGIGMPGIWRYTPSGENTSESIGIVNFASRLLRIFTIICGLWFMFNMIYAGYLFITSSGEAAVFNKFKESLFYSLLGLLIIATAYLIAGLIGAVFFGDPGFIIRPTLFQAGTP